MIQQLETSRLLLVSPKIDLASAMVQFYVEQCDYLTPWSPAFSQEFLTFADQQRRLADSKEAFEQGTAWKWFMMLNGELIGYAHYSQIVRGVFQNAMLGYALGEQWQGQGLMSEALRATQQAVFGVGQLHRVQANVIPENARSLRLLDALGFQREGLAKNYLMINGKWQDHVMMARINPDFDDQWL